MTKVRAPSGTSAFHETGGPFTVNKHITGLEVHACSGYSMYYDPPAASAD